MLQPLETTYAGIITQMPLAEGASGIEVHGRGTLFDAQWYMRSLKATKLRFEMGERTVRIKPQMLLLYGDEQSTRLKRALDEMVFDDVLVQKPWRVEYVVLDSGFSHYRLYYRRELVGIRDITSPSLIPAIRRGMAAYLAQIGFSDARYEMVPAGARTALDDTKHRIPPLFLLLGERRKGRKVDGVAEVHNLLPYPVRESVEME